MDNQNPFFKKLGENEQLLEALRQQQQRQQYPPSIVAQPQPNVVVPTPSALADIQRQAQARLLQLQHHQHYQQLQHHRHQQLLQLQQQQQHQHLQQQLSHRSVSIPIQIHSHQPSVGTAAAIPHSFSPSRLKGLTKLPSPELVDLTKTSPSKPKDKTKSSPSKSKGKTKSAKQKVFTKLNLGEAFESLPHILYKVLNEGKYPSAIKWSNDGKGFYYNPDDEQMVDVLREYFNEQNFQTWYRHLNYYGWKKHFTGKLKGMMVKERFHRGMDAADFLAIHQKRTLEKKLVKEKRKKEIEMKAKKANVSKNKNDKSKVTKTAKTTSKRKAGSGSRSSIPSNKKRKKLLNSAEAVKKKQLSKVVPSSDDKREGQVYTKETRRVREHKKLHDLFWKWDLWNFPTDLDIYLENGKIQPSYLHKKKKSTKTNTADIEPDMNCEDSEEKIASLLCDEKVPALITDEKGDKEAMANFIDRIRRDRERQEKIQELWTNSVVPNVKGKVLTPAKFAKPTDKWKKVNVGDRVGVYWRDDELFYNAIVQKQQEKTSYFYLMYDDDGAQEWLDLSREDFKILEPHENPKTGAATSSPKKAANRISIDGVDETPRKDNRARIIEAHQDESMPINLPDSHSHLAPFVRYSWKRVGLGSHTGTPSYNSFLQERDALAPKVTALDLLNDLRALRSKGFFGIPLQLDKKNDVKELGASSGQNRIIMNQMRTLNEQIERDRDVPSSMEQFDRTVNDVRKLTDNWSIPALRDNLRSIGETVLQLNERESRILDKCKKKAIY